MVFMDVPQWWVVIEEEVKTLLDNKIWILIDSLKDGIRILGGKYIFKKKLRSNNQILQYKA